MELKLSEQEIVRRETLDEIRKKYSSTFIVSAQYEYTHNRININDVEIVSENEQRATMKFNSNIIKL